MDIVALKNALAAQAPVSTLPNVVVTIVKAQVAITVNGQTILRDIDDPTLSQASGAGNEAAWAAAKATSIYNQFKTTSGQTS